MAEAAQGNEELRFGWVRSGALRLRWAYGLPARAPALGTMIVLPGRTEFIEKYDEVAAELQGRGYAVVLLDWRGQGLSERLLAEPHKGHVLDYAHYLDDLQAVLEAAEGLELPRPWVMLAHSMGGQIGLRFLGERPGRFAAAIMTAPMAGILLRPLPPGLARLLAWTAVRLGAAGRYAPGQRAFDPALFLFPGNRLTTSPESFARHRDHLLARPDLALGGVTYGWLAASLASMALTRRRAFLSRITTPVLLCQSGREQVVCNRSLARLAERLPAARLVVFPEAEHEVMMEQPAVRDRFFAEVESFLAEVLPQPQPADAPTS